MKASYRARHRVQHRTIVVEDAPVHDDPAPASGSVDPSVPVAARAAWLAVVDHLGRVAREHLNADYSVLLRDAATHLARKRPSPLLRGEPASWACGITHAVGSANFIFDRSQSPHMTAAEIAKAFGVSPATGAAKAAAVRKALRISPFELQWCLPSMLEKNPLAWMLEINGIVMDIRQAPLEFQQAAFARGLIPFVPAERESGSS
jgi:hypothetical protein